MKLRWMLLAAGLAITMTAFAWLRIGSTGAGTSSRVTDRGLTAARQAGCQVDPKPAQLAFTLKDMYGRDVKLSDYRGKVVLLNFWATWCGPCLAEIPGLIDLKARYGGRGFEILGVSVNDTPDQLVAFARQHKINYPLLVGLDHDDLLDTYGATMAIPVSVIIGRKGTICDRHMGQLDLDQTERTIRTLL